MGVGDAVDLGWKLGAVVQGWGGEQLLASYEAERRPVHQRTMDEAAINYATVGNELVRPGIEDDGPARDAVRMEVGDAILASKGREFHTLGLVLGANYHGSPHPGAGWHRTPARALHALRPLRVARLPGAAPLAA